MDKRRATHGVLSVCSILLMSCLLCLLVMIALPSRAQAASDRYLSPGESFSFSDITSATRVHIDQGGSYTLSGTARNSFLLVDVPEGQTADIYLTDGTVFHPDGSAPGVLWASRSGITIGEEGGSVNLMTMAGAHVDVYGFKGAPALRKDGTRTRLTFKTVDPANPGTLRAFADSSAYRTCAIGGYCSWADNLTAPTVGNMFFESGNIEAYGSRGTTGGPGIGADCNGSVDGLTFCGANVIAVAGDTSAAAIGNASSHLPVPSPAGENGDYFHGAATRNITITAGSVRATHYAKEVDGGGAGIGGGNGTSLIGCTITGGTVYAEAGKMAAAIGGGTNGDGLGISISGTANVTAAGESTGIGGGYAEGMFDGKDRLRFGDATVYISGGTVNASGTVGIGGWKGTRGGGEIVISGGTVTATGRSEGAGIGGGRIGSLKRISITGGRVTATGGDKGLAIGTAVSGDPNSTLGSLTISGGTVLATGGATAGSDLGGFSTSGHFNRSATPVYISGGNVRADKGAYQTVPTQRANGTTVHSTELSLETFGDRATNADSIGVASVSVDGGNYPYGTQDMYVQPGTSDLYIWIPQTTTAGSVTFTQSFTNRSGTTRFDGAVPGSTSGTLAPVTSLRLAGNGDGTVDGSGLLHYRSAIVGNMANATRPGHTLTGYTVGSASTTQSVLGADAALLSGVPGVTDIDGNWTGIASSNYRGGTVFYAQWKATTYHVAFDANRPGRASHAVAGAMASQSFTYGTAQALTTNGYSLPGWTFTGWNTKADGTGTAYANAASVQDLTDKDGATVTLFAQWAPRTYTVVFAPDGGAGTMAPQTLRYDTPEALNANAYTFAGFAFAGWFGNALGSLFADGETVVNLSGLDESGQPSNANLGAAWASTELQAVITITNDDQPLTGKAGAISLRSGGTMFAAGQFTEEAQGTGTYTLPADPALPDGTYDVLIDGYDTAGITLTIAAGTTATVDVDYCTVDITAEDHAVAWIEPGGPHVSEVTNVLEGSTLDINASVETGYAFESYTASGYAPTWQDGDPTNQMQTVTVNGQTTIEAHPASVRYQVAFAPNGGSGSMANQDMVYDEPQNLFPSTLTRTGYTFAGWTTTPEWTGGKVNSMDESGMSPQAAAFYTDGQSVSNLTTEDGGTVTLYAQWNPVPYYVGFDDNGADGYMLPQKMFFDLPSNLTACDYTWADWHFTGWNTADDGSGTAYADEAEVLNLIDDEFAGPTLYAQWERDTYTIGFDPAGGSGSMDALAALHNMDQQLPACTYIRDGYDFAGWNTAPDGGGTAYANGDVVYNLADTGGSVTLYAQWTAQPTPSPTPIPGGTTPATGDTSGGIATLLCICAIAGLGAAGSARYLRRRHNG